MLTFAREGVLFCYLLAIFLGIAGITMVFLAGRKHSTELNKALKLFLIGMLVMSLYDLLIYYTGYTIGGIKDILTLRIGSCFIAILFFLWLSVQDKIVGEKDEEYKAFKKSVKIYIFVYAGLWFASAIIFSVQYFYTVRWLLLVTDIILILTMLVGSVAYTSRALLKHRPQNTIYFMIIVTAMLLWNYASYFWGETSVYWGNSHFIREPLDLTIIFWFIVNIATVIFIYQNDFMVAYGNDESGKVEFDLDRRMEEVAKECDLTAREKALCRLIYEGKSNSQIAEALYISESTVKTHVYNIFRKLDVKNRVGVTCVIRGEVTQEQTDKTL